MGKFLSTALLLLTLLYNIAPANAQKICAMDSGAPALSTDWIEVSKNCTGSRKLSLAQVKTYMLDSLVAAQITDFSTAADARITLKRGAANGVASLDSGTKVPVGQIPNDALVSVNTVADQSAMLALSVQPGDIAIRIDVNKTFVLASSPASTLANWKEIAASGGGGADFGTPPDEDAVVGYFITPEDHGYLTFGPTITNAGGKLNTTQRLISVLVDDRDIVEDDAGATLIAENADETTFTLPSASATGFTEGFALTLNAKAGEGGATVETTGSTIGGLATLDIPAGTGCYLQSDGSDWIIDYSACSAISTIQVPGTNGQAIYNASGVLGAVANLTFPSGVPTVTGQLNVGTPNFSDTGTLVQATGNVNGYVQSIIQNTNTGSSASADLVLGGSDMTASTHYVDLGKNGPNGGGAPFTAADDAYLYTVDPNIHIAAQNASGVVNIATGSTPTTRVAVSTTGITASLPITTTSTLTQGGVQSWSSGLGAINHITGPTDQLLKLQAGTPASNNDGNGITLATSTAVSPSFGSAKRGGDLIVTTGNGLHNSSNIGGRGGDYTITLGNANSFARGGQFALTTGNGDALGSSQNGNGGGIVLTTGTGAQSNTATGFVGGIGGNLTFTGGIGGVNTGTSNAAGVGGGAQFTAGAGGTASGASGGTGGKGGGFSWTTGAGGNATGASGTRNGGNGGDIQFNPGAGGTGATANGLTGKIGFYTNGGAPQAALDNNGGSFLVRGGSTPTVTSCGTSPSVSGSTSSFVLTVGTGTVTSCPVTFVTAFLTAPKTCSLTPANATAAATGTTGAYVSAITTTGMTVTGTALAGAVYNVQCF